MSKLPPWSPLMSDGCSVPKALRWFIKVETPACRECCREHDKAYYYGGTRADRLKADLTFRDCLVSAGMPKALAQLYFLSVSAGGAPWLRIPGVSWAFGDSRFRYGEDLPGRILKR